LLTPSKTFGKNNFFAVGDLVCWNVMGKNKSGVVERLYFNEQGGRDVAFASVFEFSDGKKYEVLCLNLKKIHKSVVDEIEN
tara:strand:- start:367 stop:609 length:243 start_codon:yes stop_codon:yes gene_type:complete